MSHHSAQTPESQDQGSFLTGFTIGLFAGAMGYYLFATDNGKKVKNKLAKEWQAARESLEEKGLEEVAKFSIRETLKTLLADYLDIDLGRTSKTAKNPPSPKPKKTKTTETSSKPAGEKFKGV